jgi:hypothetical protein
MKKREEYKEVEMAEYMTDSQGRRTPVELVKAIDKLRDQTVRAVMEKAYMAREALRAFKAEARSDIQAFLELSAGEYNVTYGGRKGNISLTTYDGRYRIMIAVSDALRFDERLQVAKTLIDKCIRRWTDGSRSEVKALIEDAFYVDKQGNISTQRILGLRRLAIEDGEWRRAMEAITDSVQVASSKTYMRFYERAEDGSYEQIPLDIATL